MKEYELNVWLCNDLEMKQFRSMVIGGGESDESLLCPLRLSLLL